MVDILSPTLVVELCVCVCWCQHTGGHSVLKACLYKAAVATRTDNWWGESFPPQTYFLLQQPGAKSVSTIMLISCNSERNLLKVAVYSYQNPAEVAEHGGRCNVICCGRRGSPCLELRVTPVGEGGIKTFIPPHTPHTRQSQQETCSSTPVVHTLSAGPPHRREGGLVEWKQ